jgi:hypothetical protein
LWLLVTLLVLTSELWLRSDLANLAWVALIRQSNRIGSSVLPDPTTLCELEL